jgi:AcrR family transcriptional regulator
LYLAASISGSMPSQETKQKIIGAAITCFNQEGIANVRLQDIADEAFVSLGNMTYHYRNKEAIVQAVWEQWAAEQNTLLAEFRVLPLFEDVDLLLRNTFTLQQNYRFFYLDILEVLRAYPELLPAHQQHLHWQIQQFNFALQFNASRGSLRRMDEQDFQELAEQFCAQLDLWMYRQQVMGRAINDFENFRKTLWMVLSPYFSDMGSREFEQLGAY